MLSVRGLQKWTRGLLVASLVALGLAAPARAGNVIAFDPTGASKTDLQVSSFAYLPGNALAINGGGVNFVGKPLTIVYQAILGSINTAIGSPTEASLSSNTGNITLTGATSSNTGLQVVIEAKFNEIVASVGPGGNPLTFTTNPAILATGTNTVQLFVQSSTAANSASVNNGTGLGFSSAPPRTLILTGHVTAGPTGQGYTSSFNGDPNSFPGGSPGPDPLNQHLGTTYAGTQTIDGSGNTSIIVSVDSYLATYFPEGALKLIQLNFNTISSGVPFRAAEPETVMWDGTVPVLGPINGTGKDFLLQSQANNDFTLSPEPGTISMALTGFGMLALVALRRRKALLNA